MIVHYHHFGRRHTSVDIFIIMTAKIAWKLDMQVVGKSNRETRMIECLTDLCHRSIAVYQCCNSCVQLGLVIVSISISGKGSWHSNAHDQQHRDQEHHDQVCT